jgi:hypothetical protein
MKALAASFALADPAVDAIPPMPTGPRRCSTLPTPGGFPGVGGGASSARGVVNFRMA